MKNPLAGALALAISLLACAQESVGTQPSATNSTAAIPGQTEPVRTIVQFKNPAAINAPAFVQRLQALTPNAVRYVAAVSTDTHVYILQPQPGHALRCYPPRCWPSPRPRPLPYPGHILPP